MTFDEVIKRSGEIKSAFEDFDYEEIVFLACGSSYWASLSAYMTMQRLTGKKCFAVKSGDVVMDSEYYTGSYKKPLLILPSRSGKTSETIIAAEILRDRYQSKIIGLVEYGDAQIKDIADFTLELPWANETGLFQTRSFSNLYLASIMLAAIVSDNEPLIQDIQKYLGAFDQLSKEAEEKIRNIIEGFSGWNYLAALGSGIVYGVAVEGAYINIEMSRFPSGYYGTLEWRHGPIIMADAGTLVSITSSAKAREYEENIAKDTKAKQARVLSVSALNDFENSDYKFFLGWPCADEIVALYSVMVMQGLAYYKTLERNLDPDDPGGLVRWISIEAEK